MAKNLPVIHSEHGASKAERWLACPGSIAAERGIEDKESPHAREGTAAHKLGEIALKNGRTPYFYVGQTVEGVVATEEMADAVLVYVEYVRNRMQEYGIRTPILEHRFDLGPLNPPAPMFGTSDCPMWDAKTGTLEVIDYKHGQGVVVEAVENPQLMYYALGAVVELRVKPKRIITTIVQPRAYHPEGPIRSYEFDFPALIEFKKRLFAGAAATLDPDAPRVVGEHCRFCKAKPKCKAQRQYAIEAAQDEFDVVEEPRLPAPHELTDEQISLVLDRAEVIEGWFKSIREHVQGQLEAGIPFPGYKLVPKRATRKWVDDAAADRWLARQKVGMRDRYTKKVISPAQAEKVLKKMNLELPERYVVKESSGNNIAKNDDPRPAMLPSAVSDFDGLDG